MNIDVKNITGYVLAGGQSKRFGSDKARALFGNTPVLNHLVQEIEGLGLACFVASNSGQRYTDLGVSEIADINTGNGPMSGLQAIFLHSPTPFALILTCDMPLITKLTLKSLIVHATSHDLACIFGNNPFPGLYKTSLITDLNQAINASSYSITSLLGTLPNINRQFPVPSKVNFNMNEPTDYSALVKNNGRKSCQL